MHVSFIMYMYMHVSFIMYIYMHEGFIMYMKLMHGKHWTKKGWLHSMSPTTHLWWLLDCWWKKSEAEPGNRHEQSSLWREQLISSNGLHPQPLLQLDLHVTGNGWSNNINPYQLYNSAEYIPSKLSVAEWMEPLLRMDVNRLRNSSGVCFDTGRMSLLINSITYQRTDVEELNV